MDMRKPIFFLPNKSTYKEEYNKIMKVLSSKCILYEKESYSYFDFVNTYLFHQWKYRGTSIDLNSYLKSIGVSSKIKEESFLNFLEFLLNINLLFESKKYKSVIFNDKAKSILFHNIPLIVDEMGYSIYDIDDKICILKKDIMYEQLMELVSNDLYDLLMSYQSIENNGLKMKRMILQKIYESLGDYKQYNTGIYISIKTIVTKMGIIGDIDPKYKGISRYKMKKYYDYCFEMICYLIESQKINQYNEDIKGE